jgi:hypothetical protein
MATTENLNWSNEEESGCFYFCNGEEQQHRRRRRKKEVTPAATMANEGNDDDDDDESMLIHHELNELSFEEREQVLEEVHGVAKFQDETPAFLKDRLERFKEAVAAVNGSKRRALDRAVFYRPTILLDEAFHLLFLRADYYNAVKAAKRMAKYYEDKLTLFGEHKLVKKITLEDLNDTDRKVLDSGFFKVLPHKDQTGRPIWFCDITKFDFNRGTNLVRPTTITTAQNTNMIPYTHSESAQSSI